MAKNKIGNNAKGKILLICPDARWVIFLQKSLFDRLKEYRIDITKSTADIDKKLVKGKYQWIICWPVLKTTASTGFLKIADFFNEVKTWLIKNDELRAIVVSDDLPPEGFHHHLTYIQPRVIGSSNFEYLVEIINAGNAGYTLLYPTIINLQLEINPKDKSCSIFFNKRDPVNGPLINEFDEIIAKSCLLKGIDEIQTAFHFASNETDGKERNERIICESHDLWEKLNDSNNNNFIKFLTHRINNVIQRFKRDNNNKEMLLCPVHIHLFCKNNGELLSLPIDLALEKSAFHHLCAIAPITWRLRPNDGIPETLYRDKMMNPVDYSDFRLISSCLKNGKIKSGPNVEKLKHAEKENRRIQKTIGKGCTSKHITTKKEFSDAFIGCGDKQIFSAHIISHGIHRFPADNSAIIVGPAKGNICDEADILFVVTEMQNRRASTGPQFAYINCCDITKQDFGDNAKFSYFGGFAEGLIASGCCQEVISNRWSVDDDWASKLAPYFYETKPLTVNGRAAALFRARRMIFIDMNRKSRIHKYKKGSSIQDATWLAPVHILAE